MATPRRQRIVYWGAGAFGIPTLRALATEQDLLAVVTQPDRPAGRGKTLSPSPIGTEAEALNVSNILKPESCNTPEFRHSIRSLKADAWVVIAYGQKLGPKLLDGVFAINLHASLLPRWRGAAPIHAAVLAGDEEIGNSVITLAEEMDAGSVLAQSRQPLNPAMTTGEHHDELAEDGPALIREVLDRHAQGTVVYTEQDPSAVTLARKLSKDDRWVSFEENADSCRRRVHGLTPWPGVTVAFRGADLKLLEVEPAEADPDQEGGTLIDAHAGIVACGNGTALRLLEVQPSGRKPMAWSDFANGVHPEDGERLIGRSKD
ncbi:MAG: methionyl-tRNA formyltransferase [Planctomycetota bacterium]